MSSTTPPTASIVGARLPCVLRSRWCIRRGVGGTGWRLTTPLPPASVHTCTAAAPSTTIAASTAKVSATGWTSGNRRLRNIVVHALPAGWSALAAVAGCLLHTARLLGFVLLLLEGELFLGVVSGAVGLLSLISSHHVASLVHHGVAVGTEVAAHLLHLLHHGGIHLAALEGRVGALLHHHHGIHATHTGATHAAGLCLHHLGLHVLEVLLHALPILCHHRGCHAIVSTSSSLVLLVESALVFVAVIEGSTAAATAPTTKFLVFLFTHVTARLGALNLDGLAEDGEGARERGLNRGVTIKGYEAEAPRTVRVLVHHECGVNDAAELLEEVLEVLFCCFLRNAANKDLGRALLLFARNGSLGINLGMLVMKSFGDLWKTHNFAIKEVLLDHDDVDTFGVLESEEAESTRTTGGAISHDRAFAHLAELREVVFE
jgi:hypothetical protein